MEKLEEIEQKIEKLTKELEKQAKENERLREANVEKELELAKTKAEAQKLWGALNSRKPVDDDEPMQVNLGDFDWKLP